MLDFIILSDLTLTTIAFLLIIWKTAILLISLVHFIDYSPICYFADCINGLPRKILGYRTPEELFELELDKIYAA